MYNSKKFFILDTIVKVLLLQIKKRVPIKPSVDKPIKILICRLDHIGDVAMTTIAPHTLKLQYPKSKIYMLVNKTSESLFLNNPHVESCINYNWPWPYDSKNNRFTYNHLKSYFKLRKLIKEIQFDMVIECRGDARMFFLFGYIIPIPIRIGYLRNFGAPFLTNIVKPETEIHELERVEKIMLATGAKFVLKRPEIYLNSRDEEDLKNLLFLISKKPYDRKYAVLSPFAAKAIKEWTLDKWGEVANYLVNNYNLDVFIIGTKENIVHGDRIVEFLDKGVYSLCGKTTLRQSVSLMKNAQVVLGVDTGTLHMAASFDVPIISLFGPTHSSQFKPYSPYVNVIDKNVCACNKDKH